MLDRETHRELLKVIISLCWTSLLWFWCLKYFCGEVFIAMTDNENFIKVSVAIGETWLKYPVSLVTVVILNYMQLCAIQQKLRFKGKSNIIMLLLIVSMWAVANFMPNSFLFLPFWYGYVVFILVGIFSNKGKRKLLGVVAVVLDFAFTTLSMVLRDVKLNMCTDTLTAFILMIDIYIMTTLYYLYSYLGGQKHGTMAGERVAK